MKKYILIGRHAGDSTIGGCEIAEQQNVTWSVELSECIVQWNSLQTEATEKGLGVLLQNVPGILSVAMHRSGFKAHTGVIISVPGERLAGVSKDFDLMFPETAEIAAEAVKHANGRATTAISGDVLTVTVDPVSPFTMKGIEWYNDAPASTPSPEPEATPETTAETTVEATAEAPAKTTPEGADRESWARFMENPSPSNVAWLADAWAATIRVALDLTDEPITWKFSSFRQNEGYFVVSEWVGYGGGERRHIGLLEQSTREEGEERASYAPSYAPTGRMAGAAIAFSDDMSWEDVVAGVAPTFSEGVKRSKKPWES